MSRLALEGEVQSDEVTRLKREIAGLEQELAEAKDESQTAKQAASDSVQAIRALRKQLEPFHIALKMLFGEISRVDAESISGKENGSGPSLSVWQERIVKASPAEARILQTLLDGGGEMTLTQIRQAARTFGNTSTYLSRLSAKNWVHKTSRGSYALK